MLLSLYKNHRFITLVFATLCLVMLVSMCLPATSHAVTRKRPGFLVVFSQQGRYDKVQIQAHPSLDRNTHSCNGKFPESRKTERKLKTVGPRFIKCSAVDSDRLYTVKYGKSGATDPFSGANAVTISDVDVNYDFAGNTGGYCTYIHPQSAPVIGNVLVTSSSGCNADTSDPVTRINASLSIHPQLSQNKKYIYGSVRLTAASGEHLTKAMCKSGVQVVVNYAPGKDSAALSTKYVKRTGNNPAHCRAKFNSKSLSPKLTPGTYTLTASNNTSTHFNGGAVSPAASSITIPRL